MVIFFSFAITSVIGRSVDRLDRILDGFRLMMTSSLGMVTIVVVMMVMMMMVIL